MAEFKVHALPSDKKGLFVRLYIYKSISNKDGWFTTKVKCLRDSWDEKNQTIKKSQDGYKKLLATLDKRQVQLREAFDALEYEKIPATVQAVREKYKALVNHEDSEVPHTFKKKDYLVIEYLNLWVSENTIRTEKYMYQFRSTAGHIAAINPKLKFSEINTEFYNKLMKHFIETRKVQNGTIIANLERLITIIKAALEDSRLRHQQISTDFKKFKKPTVSTKVFWLDWETELICLEQFKPKTMEDLAILKFWLFMCYTGLRHSDANKLHPENFIKKSNGVFLDHTIIKTKLDHNIQMAPQAVALLKGWNYHVPKLNYRRVNKKIKLIIHEAATAWEKQHGQCRLMDLVEKVRYRGSERIVSILPRYKMITNHTARRTFGRRWAERGQEVRLLQQYYGHKEMQQTLDYIGWTTQEVNTALMRVMDTVKGGIPSIL